MPSKQKIKEKVGIINNHTLNNITLSLQAWDTKLQKKKKKALDRRIEKEKDDYRFEMDLVLEGLNLGEVGEVLFESRIELGILRFKLGEFGGERNVLLLEEGAGLLSGDSSRIGLCFDGFDLVVEFSDECVGLLCHQRGVVRAPFVLVL